MSLVEIRNLTHIYNHGSSFEKKALDSVSLNIEKGEFVGLIGHTGSGKKYVNTTFKRSYKTYRGRSIYRRQKYFFKGCKATRDKKISRISISVPGISTI